MEKCRRRWDLADAEHLKYRFMQVRCSFQQLPIRVQAAGTWLMLATLSTEQPWVIGGEHAPSQPCAYLNHRDHDWL